jgi:hypothetical protein
MEANLSRIEKKLDAMLAQLEEQEAAQDAADEKVPRPEQDNGSDNKT